MWHTLMTPVLDAAEGGDWQCGKNREVFKVEKMGLAQLDYMFGISHGNWYTWKEVRLGMGTLHYVDSITFSYKISSSSLTVSARHKTQVPVLKSKKRRRIHHN